MENRSFTVEGIPLYADRLGRLTTKDGEGHKAIAVTDEGTLKIEDHR